MNRELSLHFALRTDNAVEVGLLGGDIVRGVGWLARTLRESCAPWRIPIAQPADQAR